MSILVASVKPQIIIPGFRSPEQNAINLYVSRENYQTFCLEQELSSQGLKLMLHKPKGKIVKLAPQLDHMLFDAIRETCVISAFKAMGKPAIATELDELPETSEVNAITEIINLFFSSLQSLNEAQKVLYILGNLSKELRLQGLGDTSKDLPVWEVLKSDLVKSEGMTEHGLFAINHLRRKALEEKDYFLDIDTVTALNRYKVFSFGDFFKSVDSMTFEILGERIYYLELDDRIYYLKGSDLPVINREKGNDHQN